MTDLERYEYQLNAIESLIEFHPEFLDIFKDSEVELFKRYYLPDWDKTDDYREYYAQLLDKDPDILDKIRPLMNKFIAAHRIEDGDRLLP